MRRQLMKCPHGRTMERGCTQCSPPQVTATGRAISAGRVTRRSTLLRGNFGRPLPMHLQCHPKALSPTSRNPYCNTFQSAHVAEGLRAAQSLTLQQLKRGKGLHRKGRYELGGLTCASRFTDDIRQAMSYKTAADVLIRMQLEVLDNG